MTGKLRNFLLVVLYPDLARLQVDVREAIYCQALRRNHARWMKSLNFYLCCALSFGALLLTSSALRGLVPTLWLPLFAFPVSALVWFLSKRIFYQPIISQAVEDALREGLHCRHQAK